SRSRSAARQHEGSSCDVRNTCRVETARRTAADELCNHSRHAAVADLAMPLAGGDEMLSGAERTQRTLAVFLRRYGIVVAREDESWHIAVQRRIEIVIDNAARPNVARALQSLDECLTHVGRRERRRRDALLRPARGIFAANHGEVHAVRDLCLG